MKKINALIYIIGVAALLSLAPPATRANTQPIGQALDLKVKGDACYEAGRYSEALEYYTQGLEAAQRDNDHKMYVSCVGNIGNIYSSIEDYKHSIHYYIKGYNEALTLKDTDLQSRFIYNIVAAYCMMGEVKNAKAFFLKQMQTPATNPSMSKYYALANQGLIAQAERNYDMAEYYHRKACDYAKESDMPPIFVTGQYTQLGKVNLLRNRPDAAIRYFLLSDSIARRNNNFDEQALAFKNLSEAFAQKGDSTGEQLYRQRYLQLSDSIFNQNQFNMADGKLFEYENKQNQERIDRLTSTSNTRLFIIVVTMLILLAICVMAWQLWQKNKKLDNAYALLVRKNEDLIKQAGESQQLRSRYIEPQNHNIDHEAVSSTASDDKPTEAAPESVEEPGETAKRTVMSDELLQLLKKRIAEVMADISAISQPEFSLGQLAQLAGSNTKYVSYVINEHYGKSFKTFLNECRIQEACRRLTDEEHYGRLTMRAVYESVGYNSAASFIQAFKKVNGMTPSQYQKLARQKNTAPSE